MFILTELHPEKKLDISPLNYYFYMNLSSSLLIHLVFIYK